MRIGRYEVLSTLGKGGMGVVYEVQPTGGSERLALKLLLMPEPDLVERFRREARILQLLSQHRSIAKLRDLGEEQGRPFLVMDLLRGGTFATALEKGTLGREAALRTLVEIARAAHFAHEAGIIHRDLKPSNILLDESGRAYLSDFGIAKDQQAQALTQTGVMVGTVQYMAPEQAESSRTNPVDRRTNVYALGAILYTILAGRPPFEGSGITVLKKLLVDAPLPPSTGARGVPPGIEAVCLKALEKRQEKRQQTAEAFARELEVALTPTPGRPGTSEPRRGRVAVVLASIVGVALSLGLGVLLGRATANGAPTSLVPVNATPASPATFERRWTAATRLLAARSPIAPGDLDELAALMPQTPDARADGVDLAFMRARSALLAAPPPATVDVSGLPASGPGRDLFDAEVAGLGLMGKKPEEAWGLFQKADVLEPAWRADEPSDRWLWLSGKLAAAGDATRSAQALVVAAGHLKRDPRRAVDLVEAAIHLDLLAVASASGNAPGASAPGIAPGILVLAARDALQGAPDAHTVAIARRRLYLARLLSPERDLTPELEILKDLSTRKPADVANAARPWQRGFDMEGKSVVEGALHETTVSPDDQLLNSPDVLPSEWRTLVGILWKAATGPPNIFAFHFADGASECLLWRGDEPIAWYEMGLAASRDGAWDEARLCFRVGADMRDSVNGDSRELWFQLGVLEQIQGRWSAGLEAFRKYVDVAKRIQDATKPAIDWSPAGYEEARCLARMGAPDDRKAARQLLDELKAPALYREKDDTEVRKELENH